MNGNIDVAVVGLGGMGCAALFHLARRGVRVVGIERHAPGHAHGSSHGESRAIRLGYSEHPSYVPLARAAYDHWHELERLSGQTVLTRTGVLEIGKPGSAIVAGSLAASLEHGLPHEVLERQEIARRFPQFRLASGYSAVWQPDGGFVRPELGNALHLELARQAGAQIMAQRRVLAVEPGPSAVRILLDGQIVEAGAVVIAAGPWIGDVVPRLAPHLRLTRQVLCWFEARDREAVRLGNLPVFIVEGDDDVAYGFPDIGSGFKCASHLSSGAIAHADDPRVEAGADDEARMRRFVETYLPAAGGALRRMQTCLYTKTPDEDFVIDRDPDDPRIVVASPCSGHGYKFAGVIGAILADLATRGETGHDISRFSLSRLTG